jgi:cystathionine beta-lyase/cystathionine gamma-synthase
MSPVNEKDALHPVTRAIRHRIPQDGVEAAVTPLYQNSAFSADSPYFYTRKANPNCVEWEQCVALLESAAYGISTTTGMSAITLALSLIPVGGTLVVHRHLYGCSLKHFHRMAERGLFQVQVLDLTSAGESTRHWPDRVDMVLFETPTNPFLYTVGIASICKEVKALNPNALVVVDNTWATPLNQQPLMHGADISLHSATKFLSGHSDVMGGILLTQSPDID